MSTRITINAGGDALLARNVQQVQANRFAQLERENAKKVEAEAQQKREDRLAAEGRNPDGSLKSGAYPKASTRAPDPAANRRGDDYLRIEVRQANGVLSLFSGKYEGYSGEPAVELESDTGPFADPCLYFPQWYPPAPQGFAEVLTPEYKPIKADFSIETWFQWKSGSYDQQLWGIYGVTFSSFNLSSYYDSSSGGIYVRLIAGGGDIEWVSSSLLGDTWHHVTLARVADQFLVYVNGIPVAIDRDRMPVKNFEITLANIELGYVGLSTLSESRIGQFVLSPKRSRYSGNSFTPPTRRI